MKDSPNIDNEPIVLRQQVSKPFVWLVTGFASLLGAGAVFSFVDRISHAGADEWLMLAFGLIVILFAFLFARFTLLPYLTLDDQQLAARSFFHHRVFRFEDIDSLASYTLWVRPRDGKGRKIPHGTPLETKRLQIKLKDGRERVVTLPHQGGNSQLLEKISQRSGKAIAELEDQTR